MKEINFKGLEEMDERILGVQEAVDTFNCSSG